MLNEVILMGRLVADPTTYNTTKKDGSAGKIDRWRLAYDGEINSNGEAVASFIDCVAYDSKAIDYCAKGDQIVVKGALLQKEFTRKDGSKGSTFEVKVRGIEFVNVHTSEDYPEAEEPAPAPKTVEKSRARR